MADPRDTIRASLEEEWGNRAHRPGLEGRVARRLSESAGHGRGRNPRWLAVTTGVLGVVMVGALAANAVGLMSPRRPHEPKAISPVTQVTPAGPSASPSPTVAAETDYGPAPLGTPLFYYVDPRERTWMVALDWTGQPRGTLRLPQRIEDTGGYGGGILAVSPDGSRIILGSDVVDARGQKTATGVPATKQRLTWSDDSRHLCQMTPSFSDGATGIAQTLMTFLPGGAARVAAHVGTAYSQSAAGADACSLQADRALVVQAYNGDVSESWLVRLSTGAVLHHQAYPRSGNSAVALVTTHDGLYVADNTTIFSTTPSAPASAGPSVVRSGLSGTKLATMPAGLQVMGFSWDGSLAVLQTTSYGERGPAPEVRVVDWRSGRVVWRLDAGKAPGSAGAPLALDQVLAAPSSRDLALSFSRLVPCTIVGESPGVQSQCGSSYDRLRDVILVHADGSSQEVATQVQPAW